MASHIENKAMQLRDEAAKKLTPGGFFQTLFFGGSNKSDEAIDCYTRAGNLFKMSKNYLQAGLSFQDAADLNSKNGDQLEASLNYTEAANCYKKVEISKAIQCFLKAIKMYSEMGRFFTAAKLHQNIAGLMEEVGDIASAAKHLQESADILQDENHPAMAKKCLQKVAELSAMDEKYQKAIKIFQDIAHYNLTNPLLQYNAKEYFFRAAICQLCHDPDVVESLLNKYLEVYPSFKQTREYQLIMCLVENITHGDLDGYANAIRSYDATSKLSMWHVDMLLKAKNLIEPESIL